MKAYANPAIPDLKPALMRALNPALFADMAIAFNINDTFRKSRVNP